MPITESAPQYLDAIAEAQSTLLDAARAAGARQIELQQRLMDEMQAAQRRTVDLARRMVEHPADFAGNVSALIEAAGEAQARALQFARLAIEGTPEGRAEVRTRLDRITKANQEVVRSSIAALRDLYSANPWVTAYRSAADRGTRESAVGGRREKETGNGQRVTSNG
jgi:hypothetical protein